MSGQHEQLIPVGSGRTLQIVSPIDAQLAGRSLGSSSQHPSGHSSIKWLQDVGNALGSGVGADEGVRDGSSDGRVDGAGDGTGVGLQSSRSIAP